MLDDIAGANFVSVDFHGDYLFSQMRSDSTPWRVKQSQTLLRGD
jgi:hypothetical protein